MKNLYRLAFLVLAFLSACTAQKGTQSSDQKTALSVVTPETKTKPRKPTEEDLVKISTPQGDIYLILFDATPLHKANFLKLAQEGFYTGTTFHRIIKNFMIQGGDPNSKNDNPADDGQGGPGYTIPAEFVDSLTHVQGALAAARMGDGVNPKKESSGSQFYIVENKTGTHFLDRNYTVFGQVIKGLDVVEKIALQPKGQADRPLSDIKITVTVERRKKADIIEEFGPVHFR